mmetsp:Transcript_27211/g.81536  ORF Transcript_27211/g.81536 Transcript_27211/m.81536 type:complete len:227 (+) Transcript_27211:1188-1868(+)
MRSSMVSTTTVPSWIFPSAARRSTVKLTTSPESWTASTMFPEVELSRTKKSPCSAAATAASASVRPTAPAYHGATLCIPSPVSYLPKSWEPFSVAAAANIADGAFVSYTWRIGFAEATSGTSCSLAALSCCTCAGTVSQSFNRVVESLVARTDVVSYKPSGWLFSYLRLVGVSTGAAPDAIPGSIFRSSWPLSKFGGAMVGLTASISSGSPHCVCAINPSSCPNRV